MTTWSFMLCLFPFLISSSSVIIFFRGLGGLVMSWVLWQEAEPVVEKPILPTCAFPTRLVYKCEEVMEENIADDRKSFIVVPDEGVSVILLTAGATIVVKGLANVIVQWVRRGED